MNGGKMIYGWNEGFPADDPDRVDRALELSGRFGVRRFLVSVSRELWGTGAGRERYRFLLSRLSAGAELTVRLFERRAAPGRNSGPAESGGPAGFVDFVREVLDDAGGAVGSAEIVYGPGMLSDWKWWIDPDLRKERIAVLPACRICRERGIPVSVGGIGPENLTWLDLLCRNGVLAEADAVGLRYYPDPGSSVPGSPYRDLIGNVRSILDLYGIDIETWITGTGISSRRRSETEQLRLLAEALQAPADRLYWDSLMDQPSSRRDGSDARGHSGLIRYGGGEKLAGRVLLQHGIEGTAQFSGLVEQAGRSRTGSAGSRPADGRRVRSGERPVLITGGAGFIGTNLAARLLSDGVPVIVLDAFVRPGVEENFRWLRSTFGADVSLQAGDIRDRDTVREAVRDAGTVYHLSAQVAVTTSLDDPLDDLEVNGTGTLNLLEAVRRRPDPPGVVFTSTNKVYGSLSDVLMVQDRLRYSPTDGRIRQNGIGESRPLDFHSPYGCSKGVADQYVRDYARVFGIPTVVFRMSCIYGQHQFGTEDQGWVAHFILRALQGEEISIFGDGRQVRDILHVDDLVEAFLLARRQIDRLGGKVFNIGGGPDHTVSLLELVEMLNRVVGNRPAIRFSDWRKGDQRYYVSDIRGFERMTGWSPTVNIPTGISRLASWLREYRLSEHGSEPLREEAV